MAFDQNSKLQDILAVPEATAILEKHIPGVSKNPQLKMVKNFSLKAIAGFPQAGIKPDVLKAVVDDLAALG